MNHNSLAIVFAILVATTMVGCDPANSPDTPRPSDAGFINWLMGERVTAAPGIIFDDVWIIEDGEISDFKVHKITTNPADGSYAATVSFRATASGRGIQVSESVIRYKKC